MTLILKVNLRLMVFSNTSTQKLYMLIGWQAYRGDQIHRKNSPIITLKSNPGKVQKRLLGLYTYKTQLTEDFGQIWVAEN